MSRSRPLCRFRITLNGGRLPLSSPAVECVGSICSGWTIAGGCGEKCFEMPDGSLISPLVDDRIRYLPLEEWIGSKIPEEDA